MDANTFLMNHSRGGLWSRLLLIVGLGVAVLALLVTWHARPAAADELGLSSFDVSLTNADGSPATQAGAHPYAMDLRYTLNTEVSPLTGVVGPVDSMKDVSIDLPEGLIGDPTAVPRCSHERINTPPFYYCPADTQIGFVYTRVAGAVVGAPTPPIGLYNMEPPPGVAAQFAFNFGNTQTVYMDARVVRTAQGSRIRVTVPDISQKLTAYEVRVTLWGVPADPRHDVERCKDAAAGPPVMCPAPAGNPATDDAAPHSVDIPIKPFLTNPTRCGVGLRTKMTLTSWTRPDVLIPESTLVTDSTGAPVLMQGCDKLDFSPSLDVRPDDTTAGQPSGYSVDLTLPQHDNPEGLASGQLRKAVVSMPPGTAVSPSSADGLGACSPSQIGLDSDAPPSCPASSRIGTVSIDTPLLADPLEGYVYLATQNDNPFATMLALYLVADGPGVRLKLPGRIAPDPATGQLVATFDDTPQLPFSRLHLHFKGGSRAPLVNSSVCGTTTATAQLTSWAGGAVTAASPVTVSGDGSGGPCPAARFQPELQAGTESPVAGASSPFSFDLTRTDTDSEIQTIHTTLPAGLLARVKTVPLCPSAAAAAGTCGVASLVGHVAVGAGAGTTPFYLSGGRVYLTEAYKGGSFGLSIVVPALAGPLDLGNVVVRAAVHLDPKTAQITVDTDPLPTILQGIPLKLRDIRLTMDRPGFMINPTSCDEQRITGAVTSTTGAMANVASRFEVGDCEALALHPKLGLSLSPRKEMGSGRHPTLHAHLTQGAGQSGLRNVKVHLPKSLGIDIKNIGAACKVAAAAADACPASAIVGRATVTTILHEPLAGPVYFVERTRTDAKTGKSVATLPGLFIPLRGDGVRIDLTASSDVRGGRVTSSFDDIPDAPISSFDLTLDGGRHGILVTGSRLCAASQRSSMDVLGQNGKAITGVAVPVTTSCPPKRHSRKRPRSHPRAVVR